MRVGTFEDAAKILGLIITLVGGIAGIWMFGFPHFNIPVPELEAYGLKTVLTMMWLVTVSFVVLSVYINNKIEGVRDEFLARNAGRSSGRKK